MMFKTIRNLRSTSGLYIALSHSCARLMSRLRGAVIGSRCGSMNIHIGPRAYLRGLSCIRIGASFETAEGLWLEALTFFDGQVYTPKIVIGDRVHVSRYAHIAAVNYIEIGPDVLIGSNVLITDHNHGSYKGPHQSNPSIAPMKRHLMSDGPVVIGPNAWIGDHVVITPGCTIGEGAIIGANSVVTTNIPQFTIAAGVPARCIKTFDFDAKVWTTIL